MSSNNRLNPVEASVLHDAVEIAVETLREKHQIAFPRVAVVANLILEIGERRIKFGAVLKAEADAKSVASFATAILTKVEPR